VTSTEGCAPSFVRTTTVRISSEYGLLGMTGLIRRAADEIALGVPKTTLLVTAACEVVRNTMAHAGGGNASVSALRQGSHACLQVLVREQGPWIAGDPFDAPEDDAAPSLLGLELPDLKHWVDEFEILGLPGKATCVILTSWT
jgi:serine/threonine-protein kinase RsbT